ncbi:MAG: hypothetical protein GF335_00740, partial [Candidatus Moranbacteria bacterium]|nr:hypothetical protein [Candidatus Moranbacteria bacterium]
MIKKKIKKFLVISFFIVSLFSIIGLFYYSYFKKDKDKEAKPQISQEKKEKQEFLHKFYQDNQRYAQPFIKNNGQKNELVRFYAQLGEATVYISPYDITYDIQEKTETQTETEEQKINGLAIKEKFIDNEKNPINLNPQGEKPSPAKINYFLGYLNNEQKTAKAYNFIDLGEIYPNIEVKLKARQKNIEKLFIINPQGDSGSINIKPQGVEKLEITKFGELKLIAQQRELVLTNPQAYQYEGGKKHFVPVSYELREGNTYGFKLESYDNSKPVIIDPLVASTMIGGAEEERFEFFGAREAYVGRPNITQDGAGNVYVVGHTRSSNYPASAGAYDIDYNDSSASFGNDIVVSKFNSTLDTLLASTYLGGTGEDNGMA